MSEMVLPALYPLVYEPLVRRTLEEDLGLAGDLTTDATVPAYVQAQGLVVARSPGRVAGLDVALAAFRLLDPSLVLRVEAPDGHDVAAGTVLARVSGSARPILSAERTALNLLGRLCGIATATRSAAQRVAGTRARVVCTRKTTPGLRALEKYAVRVGGGFNHRYGLDDAVLIKDNHLVAAGGVRQAVTRARARLGHMVKIEVEVDTLEQLRELLELPVDAVLLDNMSPATLRAAVTLVNGRLITEASGGITLANLREVAETGVDMISLGSLTHSVSALDVALDFVAET